MTGSGEDDWDAVFKPRVAPLVAYGVAALIAAVGITIALLLRKESTGPTLRPADQIAMAGLALLLAAAVLLLARPRLKIGRRGLAVRNILEYRLIGWDEVVDVAVPPGGRWARVELGHNEYVPVLAIQVVDRERAAVAMDAVRESMARHRGPEQ